MSNDREAYKKWLQREGDNPSPGRFSEEAAEGWRAAGVEKYDDLLAAIDKTIDAKTGANTSSGGGGGRVVQFPFAKWAAVAAAVLILILAGWWALVPQQPTSEKLYAAYFQPRTHPDAMVRGEEGSLAETEKVAVEAYVANDFVLAIKQYEILVRLSPKEPKHVLFLAIAYMGDGQTARAIKLLDGYNLPKNPYEADMRWYLALAYLKQGSVNTAKGLLESLSKGESYYAGSAQELLSAMK